MKISQIVVVYKNTGKLTRIDIKSDNGISWFDHGELKISM